MRTVFPDSGTAAGVVAAGEGATFVLALVYVLLTLLGESAPAPVRVGLWLLPVAASATGAQIGPEHNSGRRVRHHPDGDVRLR